MKYVKNFEETKQRFKSFWKRKEADRCCIAITAPKDNSVWPNFGSPTLEKQWLDSEYRFSMLNSYMEITAYYGEALPNICPNYGPGVLAAFAGSDFELDNGTVWFDRNPMLKTIESISPLKLNSSSPMWQSLRQLTNLAFKNDVFLATTDIGGTLDIAASFRGAENILMDLIEYSEEIKKLCDYIDDFWIEIFTKLTDEIGANQDGYTAWLSLWNDKKWYPLQCDLSVMISKEMFNDFVVPSLTKQAKAMDTALYHLDGPGEIQHLDSIMAIKGINAIQWVPMPKPNGYLDNANPEYFPMYRKILENNKSLVLNLVDPDCVEFLLSNIPNKGLYISTSVASEKRAKELIKIAENCYKKSPKLYKERSVLS